VGNISLEFDAAGSNIDGTNPGTALALSTANGYAILAFEAPEPEQDVQWASSADTEGETIANSRRKNRQVSAQVRLTGATDAALETSFNTLGKKIEKLNAEGGTFKLTTPAGTVGFFDVLSAGQAFGWTIRLLRIKRAEVQFTLICKPLIRTAEQDLGDNVETTLPVLIFSDTIPGETDATGRLVVDNDATADWWSVIWGAETDALYTHTTSSGSGALFYEAESRTVLGGAATAVGPTGASGAGSNVVRHTSLTNTEQAILSTQATGGGSHLSHVGTFRVFARAQVPTANTGTVSLRLSWTVGDSQAATRNTAVPVIDMSLVSTIDAVWRTVDLGLVTIRKTSGTHRWEGRVLASSTVTGDDVDIDYLVLVPTGVGYGAASALPLFQDPTTFSARDEFDQIAGALAAKTLPVGGTWSGAGDADDFTVNATSHVAQRTAVSDTTGAVTNGRWAIAGVTTYTNIYVQVDASYTAAAINVGWGVFARYTDANNWAAIEVFPDFNIIQMIKMVAATQKVLTARTIPGLHVAGLTKRLRLQIDDQGRAFAWFGSPTLSLGEPVLRAQSDDLATGGTLATGKIGFFDHKDSSGASTRTYDNFLAAVPTKDAAVFAGQSLEIRHNGVERENAAGTAWSRLSSYTGSYLRPPPAGNEGRSLRVIVKPCRNDPATMPDTAIDDISAHLWGTARFLVIPD
jgi:hypothetical protein